MFKNVQLQQQFFSFNSESYSSKDIIENGKSSVEDEDIIIIATRPAIIITFSPIGRNIEFPQTHRFSEKNHIIIGNPAENKINLIINHNLILKTNVNITAMIE